jgi:hypothetical protein
LDIKIVHVCFFMSRSVSFNNQIVAQPMTTTAAQERAAMVISSFSLQSQGGTPGVVAFEMPL